MSAGEWWREGVIYQLYPRSFQDSNADGIGDLRGVIDHLDYLQWLGVDAVWLNPITVSPDADVGYDVADYCGVQPFFGDLGTVDQLIAEAKKRDIKIVLDIVPNHSSDRHPWFIDARSSRSAAHRDWYVWADPKPDGSPPNNWLSAFGGPAWTLDTHTGQYYLHNFLAQQPDLNWWNPAVRDAFDDIYRFWFDRGIAGFRIDVAHGIVKDRELRDNPLATKDDPPHVRAHGQRSVHNVERPEVHDVLRRWRALADTYDPPRILLGETYVLDVRSMAAYYGQGDELHLAFNFTYVHAPFEASALARVVAESEVIIPAMGWPVWTVSNHDVSRVMSRWAGGDERKLRCALLSLLTLRGTPVVYYGDEIGMPDTRLRKADLQDPLGKRFWPEPRGRDPERTPMQWSNAPGGGFTQVGVRPWLPTGDVTARNVADQQRDRSSILYFVRDLIAVRRQRSDLRSGSYKQLPSPAGVWAWQRGDGTVIALNMSDEPVKVPTIVGSIVISTIRSRDGERVDGGVALSPWEGALCSSAST
ncbi:MAG TPA: alpha-amylase family glycosyl hydrolase [Candidatus Dormibacteraeota bacterium]|nr:alpha-amylase family glycosyl hydrolase [Candidatus Dormibacteraeota bacterium]